MGWTLFAGIAIAGAIGALALEWRRRRRLVVTQQTMRCPVYDCRATLAVQTDPRAASRSRYVDVKACSLQPALPIAPPPPPAYFAGASPYMPFLMEVSAAPPYPRPQEPACATRCLAVLNAAESWSWRPIECTSGTSDAMDLARQTQNPAIMRQVWLHGV